MALLPAAVASRRNSTSVPAGNGRRGDGLQVESLKRIGHSLSGFLATARATEGEDFATGAEAEFDRVAGAAVEAVHMRKILGTGRTGLPGLHPSLHGMPKPW